MEKVDFVGFDDGVEGRWKRVVYINSSCEFMLIVGFWKLVEGYYF